MHTKVLSRWLASSGAIGHAKRSEAVVRTVSAVVRGGRLALTSLGRSRPGTAHVKHQIKAVDRLLGNRHLSGERDGIYRAMAKALLRGKVRPVISIDWSDIQTGRQWVMLKAAIPAGGRAVTLYERVFPISRYNSPGANREFLASLRSVLPEACRPILVTDAAFRGPWFREVESYGWDWISRVRANCKYYKSDSKRWCWTRSLYPEATTRPRFVGRVALGRNRSHQVGLYLVRERKVRMGRPPNRRGPRRANHDAYRRSHREPWLLASSLAHGQYGARRITKLYATRMQIEETFRDLKGHRWGFGLCYARCNQASRLQVLLLIAALATLLSWLVGLAARSRGLDRQLQANTERQRTVLSAFFVGRELLRRQADVVPEAAVARAFATLRAQIQEPFST
jgi:hypothetical protein